MGHSHDYKKIEKHPQRGHHSSIERLLGEKEKRKSTIRSTPEKGERPDLPPQCLCEQALDMLLGEKGKSTKFLGALPKRRGSEKKVPFSATLKKDNDGTGRLPGSTARNGCRENVDRNNGCRNDIRGYFSASSREKKK